MGLLDSRQMTNRHTECPGQAMRFLAAGHKIRTGFLRNAEIIQKNWDEILKSLDRQGKNWRYLGKNYKKIRFNLERKKIQKKIRFFRQNLDIIKKKKKEKTRSFRRNLNII
jgi:hypothetical protein